MSKYTSCISFSVGALVAVTISGCLFLPDENCSFQDYCRGDKLYAADGPGEWSGCIDYILEDCAETGRVCQEYNDGYAQEAGCFYPEIQCDSGARALCDGDFVYRCDSYANAAVERESCAETGRVCREYTDESGETAGCFYEGISCEVSGGAAAMNDVCDDDFAYVCDPNAEMAFKRTDCTETGEICVQVENWGAVCTTACAQEGERMCNATTTMIVRCNNGAWTPEQACGYGSYCEEVEQAGAVELLCVAE